uniref:Uncharacterized protein n=1 Tax=Acrobeloides nanus TaxID=290746 RepID=A0A914DQB0_9BILA
MTASQLNCLSQQGFDLLSVNVFNTINETANIVGIQNYGLAAKASWYFEAYMYPCVSVNCSSAWDQINTVLDAMFNAGICEAIFYIGVDNSDANNKWPKNTKTNQEFLEKLIEGLQIWGYNDIGIYTSQNNWDQIFGSNYNLNNSNLDPVLLWNVAWNGVQDLTSGFTPFGGFTQETLTRHQYAGNVKSNQCYTCGACYLDYNYYPTSSRKQMIKSRAKMSPATPNCLPKQKILKNKHLR